MGASGMTGRKQQLVQFIQIPVAGIHLIACHRVHGFLHLAADHIHDVVPHVLAAEYPAPLRVDQLSLLIHNLIVLQQVLADREVVALDLLLCFLDRTGKHLVFDL